MAGPFLILDLPDEAATQAHAQRVAMVLRSGDAVGLWGGLGAAKTTLARAVIRTLADDPGLEVPSPTFTLVQTYTVPRLTVAHVDLYRIADPREIGDAGLFEGADVLLVEWPERAGGGLPPGRLDVVLEMAGAGRRAALSANNDWQARLTEGDGRRDRT
jgi:tRNA threonylcarbamoyl adenosine modification protein YjeE